MLWDLVNSILGSVPERYEFLLIFGVLFILYFLVMIFNLLYQAILNVLKGL